MMSSYTMPISKKTLRKWKKQNYCTIHLEVDTVHERGHCSAENREVNNACRDESERERRESLTRLERDAKLERENATNESQACGALSYINLESATAAVVLHVEIDWARQRVA